MRLSSCIALTTRRLAAGPAGSLTDETQNPQLSSLSLPPTRDARRKARGPHLTQTMLQAAFVNQVARICGIEIARVAEGVRLAWDTANGAAGQGRRILTWRQTRRGDKSAAVITDLTPVRPLDNPRLGDRSRGLLPRIPANRTHTGLDGSSTRSQDS